MSGKTDGSYTDQDEQWMRQALALAQRAGETAEVPVGAVVVLNQQIIGSGHNHPIGQCDPTAHAEIMAIRQACQREKNYRIPGATLYVTIEPCAMCAGAIVQARIDRVVYGALEPKAGAIVSAQHFFEQPFLNHKVSAVGGCLAESCSVLMSAFFAQRRAFKKRLKLNRPLEP